ncbi:MAG: hypothetical protein KatS3mg035_0325 [Bacteroidia bacterium]|nr:MAG: hypothetical protein KatS3mg035_0325 [Bacteroidia bacterium]
MRRTVTFICLIILISCISELKSQIVNGYAQVTNISGTTLTIGVANETNDAFDVGDKIIIMQMQDNVIGTNTADNASFGNLSSIASAGLYEVARIIARSGSNITVDKIDNTYNINANSRVQIITFRRLGAPDYTTTGNITGLAWNGDIGGVIAIEVPGTLTLNHSINANGIGFRGGSRSNNWDTPAGCRNTPYRNNNANYGRKGEGIYRNTNANYNYARGKILTGGGGGNDHNGGGGGGGNFSYGGQGGGGWNGGSPCAAGTDAGGLGGISLAPYISINRIFMGGGGGGGQQNNSLGTNGGNGGGIILLSANTIQTSCAGSVSITANGLSSSNAGNDATGGGGAGGTIVIQCNNFNVPTSCPIYIQTNGGNTGNVGSGNLHGAGGAGGKGAIFMSVATNPPNVNLQANNGNAGCNNNASPCLSFGGSAGPGSSIFFLGHGTPLPLQILHFNAYALSSSTASIEWTIPKFLKNIQNFIVLKSQDSNAWYEIHTVEYQQNKDFYSIIDPQLVKGNNYYKILQVDYDGNIFESEVKNVYLSTHLEPQVYPNPFKNELNILMQEDILSVYLLDAQGKIVLKDEKVSPQKTFDTEELPKGIYILQIQTKEQWFYKKLIK